MWGGLCRHVPGAACSPSTLPHALGSACRGQRAPGPRAGQATGPVSPTRLGLGCMAVSGKHGSRVAWALAPKATCRVGPSGAGRIKHPHADSASGGPGAEEAAALRHPPAALGQLVGGHRAPGPAAGLTATAGLTGGQHRGVGL